MILFEQRLFIRLDWHDTEKLLFKLNTQIFNEFFFLFSD